MSHSLFDDPQDKLANAREHIRRVEQEIGDFRAEAKPTLVSHSATQVAIRLRGGGDPPRRIALAIGDSIHNLRSALDHLAGDVVEASGKSRKAVSFPFAGFEGGLEKQIKDKNFHKAIPEAIDLLKSFKPFKGGNVLLRAIHDLDVIDKHAFVLSPTPMTKIPYVRIGTNVFMGELGGDIIMDRGMDFEFRGEISHTVYFSNGQPLAGEEVVPYLHEMASLTERIIHAFAALFRAA